MRKINLNCHFFAIIAILCWAPAYILTGQAMQYFSSSALGFIRYFIASILLLAVIWIKKIRPPEKQDFFLFLLSGACGYSFYMIWFNKGAGMVTAATSSIIIATAPIISDLLASIIFKEKLKISQWLCVALEFIGIIVLMLPGRAIKINEGVFWLMGSALLLGIYNILQRKLTKKYDPLQVSIYSIFVGTVILAFFSRNAFPQLIAAPALIKGYILYLSIFSSGLGYISWTVSLSKTKKTSIVTNYMFITPLLATFLGFLVARQIPDLQTIIGGVMILCGAFMFFSLK